MKRLKLMFQSVYSIDAIYELRKTPMIISLVMAMLLGIISMFPFTLMFFQDDTYRWDRSIWELEAHDEQVIMNALPNDCMIEGGFLSCSEFHEIEVNESVTIQFNGNPEEIENGVVFNEAFLYVVSQGQRNQLNYQSLEGFDFGELKGAEDGYEILFTGIAQALRPVLIMPFVAGVYQTGIVSFLIYTFVVSTISMLFKFGHGKFISFKEVFNIIIFSSVLPIIVVLVVGILFSPAFTTIIYNMGTPIMAYTVYRRKIVLSLQK